MLGGQKIQIQQSSGRKKLGTIYSVSKKSRAKKMLRRADGVGTN